ncbi:DMT family transporter [Albibacillus kandeliae]|uniref:DMT family transporter n=1 Tax=Albibacillus kandeliae TaxID=2174228 RepID=UPI000D68E6B1|nr:DMT family transporter [Albibacillus kandeliae]
MIAISQQTTSPRAATGIAFMLAAMVAISINDMLIKHLSGDYPLHQIVFTRSAIGIIFSMMILQIEGGFRLLRTAHPVLHVLRGLLVVVSNMTYFVALAVMPLADAVALFFAAPLFITLLSIPILGEKVGPLRMGAVIVGFIGVIIMQRPWESSSDLGISRFVMMLPVISALTYALLQLLTRKLGATSSASAMSIYIQAMFVLVSLGFLVIAGDGRFAEGSENQSVIFLLRAWVWPGEGDWWPLLGLGLNSAIVGYCLSQAYRLTDAATIAPYEYIGLPLAVFWGWFLWSDLPGPFVWAGMSLIIASGLFVFFREKQKARKIARAAEVKGRY